MSAPTRTGAGPHREEEALKYLIVPGRELCEGGDSFIVAEPVTAEFCDMVLKRAARLAAAAAHDDPPCRMTFADDSDLWAAVEVLPAGASTREESWTDATALLDEAEKPYLLVDRVREQREPDSAVRGVSMVVDGHDFWWEGYQKHSDVNIETEMVPLSQVRQWRERGQAGRPDPV
jgi:hypothetical protein